MFGWFKRVQTEEELNARSKELDRFAMGVYEKKRELEEKGIYLQHWQKTLSDREGKLLIREADFSIKERKAADRLRLEDQINSRYKDIGGDIYPLPPNGGFQMSPDDAPSWVGKTPLEPGADRGKSKPLGEPGLKITATTDNFAILRAANVARNPEWFPDGAVPVLPASFRGTELAGETGEAIEAAMAHLAAVSAAAGRVCNVLKKLERERLGLNGSKSTKEALAEEIGDMVICLDLVGMDFDIGLWQATVSKFNATSDKLGMKTRMPDLAKPIYTFEDCSFRTVSEPIKSLEPEDPRPYKTCGGDGYSRTTADGECVECGGEGIR